MALQETVLIGHANGDIHFLQVMEAQKSAQLATDEAKEIGKLTNAGFRTIVAAVWMREETKSAGLLYAAAWNEMEVQVLLHHGSRMVSSHELYRSCFRLHTDHITSADLLQYCRRLNLS